MKRIISYLMLFSFLFSTYGYGLMLSREDNWGVMPVAREIPPPFFYQEVPEYFREGEFSLDQAQPPLDISGIKEIQSIPVGEGRIYIKGDKRPGKIPAEKILESIANLAIMQFDVEQYTITIKNPDGKEETIIGGEFGRILRKEILYLGPTDLILGVEHVELVQTPGLTPKFDEDKYELWINDRQIKLILARDFGRPDKGFPEWGVRGLVLTQYVKDSGNPPKTEERDLYIDKDRAYYEIRILAPNGRLLEWKKWKFLPGNPNPVAYWEGKGS